MRKDIDLHSVPIRHHIVYICFSKRLNRVCLVSGDSWKEALSRLVKEDDRVWQYSCDHIGTTTSKYLELAGMLDETDKPYAGGALAKLK